MSYGARDFVVSNALMWLTDYHVDGLRLDAVHAIFDESALHILEELSTAVERLAIELKRELWLIAESDRNDPRICRPRAQNGYGIDACWDDDFHHALHTVLTGESQGYYLDFGRVSQLAKAFRDGYVFDGQFSDFRQRRHGRPARDLPGHRSYVASKTTTRSVTAPSGTVYQLWSAGPAESRRRACAPVAFRPDAFSGRGVGGVDALPLFH